MKKSCALNISLPAWALFTVALCSGPLEAAPAAQPAKTNVVQHSIFIMPTSPKEGIDPFFPNSTRPYETTAPTTHAAPITSLVLRGISGSPGHRLVVINNQNFGAGDEGDVGVPGGKIHVRCLEIKEDSVIIEAGGQRRELRLSPDP